MATDTRHGRVVPAVFFLSAAAMANEIILIRLLSFRFWPHFVPLIISQAMLGLGVSGVALHLLRPRVAGKPGKVFAWVVILTASSFELAFRASRHVPFDPYLLLWDPSSWPAFALFFFLLAVPFFLAGTAVGVPLSFRLGRIGAVYAASFTGSAVGAVLALLSFSLVPTESLLRVPLGLGLAASAFVLTYPGGRFPAGRVLCAGLSSLLLVIPPVTLSLSPYKDLAIARRLPEAETLSVRFGITGDYRALYSPGIHNAPGLSFRFDGEIPPQAAVFADGELRGIVPRGGGKIPPAYLGYLPAALPYRMTNLPTVVQFALRGTEGILMAAGNGASSVTVVEPAKEYVRMIEQDLAVFSGGFPSTLQLEIRKEGGRNFLAREGRKYDIIELSDVSSLTFSSLGIHATGETYLLTREGIRGAMNRLTDNGVLAVSGWLKSPPRESLKILSTIRMEMDREDEDPARARFVVVRGWGSFVAVARRMPFTGEELDAARRFCRETGFAMVWPEGGATKGGTGPEEAGFREAVRSILSGRPTGKQGEGLFDLRPVTDDSPYFHRFLKPGSLPEFRRILGNQWFPFVEWGVVFLALSLAVSLLLAAVFLLLPLPFAPAGGSSGGIPVAVYFSFLGLAYMLVELTFLKIGILVLGDPIRAVTAAIGGFLLLSGIGSAVSGRWEASRSMKWAFPGIAIFASAGFLTLFHGADFLLAKGEAQRFFAFLVSLAPAAFLMGMPFPVALSRMAGADSRAIPYAWGVNGFFSVAGASLASVGSLWFGFHATIAAGAILYLLAGAVFPFLGSGTSSVR
ncbi:MAG: hypothetical protein HKM86_07710 [Deltaproteobacteria bacterium]|nr:hypothetical protein [Deltaproteobacteria bacterium]